MPTPELEPTVKPPESAEQVLDHEAVPEIPAAIEQAGVSATPTKPQPITDDNGQIIAQPDPTAPTIVIPAQQQQLLQNAKGDAAQSSTWLSVFWLRLVKKAIFLGRKVVFGKEGGEL